MRDVVIVGGGIAGLAAGWRLRHRDTILLESAPRVGGRLRSERRGPYWMNWGGHVFAGGDSVTAGLLRDCGVDSLAVPGSLTGLAMNGALLLGGRVETYPWRIPMSWSSRVSLLRAGAKVRVAVSRYAKVVEPRPGEHPSVRQQRIYDFMNDVSFADFVGELPPDAEALFKPTVTRSSADMHEMSAGAGVGYFSLVWNIGAGLSQNIVGGPATLTGTLAGALGDRVQLGAVVREVRQSPASVVVRYEQAGADHEVEARCAVLATPATVAHEIAADLAPETRRALARIRYGPYVSAAFLTGEAGPEVWDDAYAIATPKRSFNVVLNMSNVVRGYEGSRQPGSSMMVFSPATLARELMARTDDDILETYLEDLDAVLPGFARHVTEAEVQRWPTGAPYCFPGRARLQQALRRRGGRVLLAGDYLGTLYTETAISTGLGAAQEAQSLLATTRQSTHRSQV